MVETRRGRYPSPTIPVSRTTRRRGRTRNRIAEDEPEVEQNAETNNNTEGDVASNQTPIINQQTNPPLNQVPPIFSMLPPQGPIFMHPYYTPTGQTVFPGFYNQSFPGAAQIGYPIQTQFGPSFIPPQQTTTQNSGPIFTSSTPIQPTANNDIFRALPKFAKYSDEQNSIPLRSWFTLYERQTRQSSDEARAHHLVCFLEGKALDWYVNHDTANFTWPEIKAQMIKYFCDNSISALAKAWKVKLGSDSIFDYFHKKQKFLAESQLSIAEQIDCLNDGLPPAFQQQMLNQRHTIFSVDQWLDVARAAHRGIESQTSHTHGQNRNRQFAPSSSARPYTSVPSTGFKSGGQAPQQQRMNQNKPNKPCWHCKNLGKPKEFHWHSQCPNNPNRGTIHVAEGGSDTEVALNSVRDRSSASWM